MEWFASLRALLGLDAAVNKGIEGEEAVAAKLAEKGWFRVYLKTQKRPKKC